MGPPTRIRAGIRTDYVVVSPHIIRVRIHKILTLNVTALTGRYYILIGCFVPKHPDTLNPNGNSIIHSEAAHSLIVHVEPGPFRGPFTINLVSLSSSEGSRPLRGLPLRLPICTPPFGWVANVVSDVCKWGQHRRALALQIKLAEGLPRS